MITVRHRKSGLGLASTLVVVLGCLLIGPSAASASTGVDCWGGVAPTAKKQTELTYHVTCSDTIKSFSFVSSLEIGEFSTTADVFDPSTKLPVEGETFACEGPIPGDGFGCSGNANPPHMIIGTVALDQARCVKRRNKLRAWVVAVDTTGASTGPFGLSVPRCPKKVTKAKKARH